MKKACIICLLCSVFMVGGFAQSIEYFSTFDSNEALETSLVPYDVVSIDSSRFVVAANSQDGTKACLLGIDEVGNMQLSATIAEEGHHIHLIKMFLSGDKIVAFAIDKADGDVNSSLMTIHLDTELNIVYQHIEPVMFPNNFINVFSIEKIEETYIAAFITGSFDTEFFTAKIDDDGHITTHAQYEAADNVKYINDIFKTNNEEKFAVCAFTPDLEHSYTILVFDTSLELVETKLLSWIYQDFQPSSICGVSTMMSKCTILPMPRYGKYAYSSPMNLTKVVTLTEVYNDKCTVVGSFDTSFELNHTELFAIGWLNDTTETTARFRSLDGIYDESSQKTRLYQCTKVDHLNYSGQNYPSHILVVQCDENLNVGWHKRYFNNENCVCYDPSTINATMDGGCLVVGTMHNIDSVDASKIFALKINDDSFSLPENKAEERPYTFYPNPANDELNLNISPEVEPSMIELYDIQGRRVRSQENNFERISLRGLPVGTYALRVSMKDGKSYTSAVVKK